jgi:hypothetical protein
VELLDQAQELVGTRPLPDDAESRLQRLKDKAIGAESELIGQLFEALIVARTTE